MLINWLLTRKCNLRCSYCGIVRDSVVNKYPDIKHYIDNEMPSQYVISTLKELNRIYGKENLFHIFYGGEPFIIYEKLKDIIKYCNKENIYYTIITNSYFPEKVIQLAKEVNGLKGLSVSLDPTIFSTIDDDEHRIGKSNKAVLLLLENKKNKFVDDFVIETTLDRNNYKYLSNMLKYMKEHFPFVNISITAYDAPKSMYYDFSYYDGCNKFISNYKIQKDDKEIINYLYDIYKDRNKYNIHCPELLPTLIEHISGDFMLCETYKNTLTIDSDGTLRLCLRIKGLVVPRLNILETLKESENIISFEERINKLYKIDYKNLCKGCNWTCPMMNIVSNKNFEEIVCHSSLRINEK